MPHHRIVNHPTLKAILKYWNCTSTSTFWHYVKDLSCIQFPQTDKKAVLKEIKENKLANSHSR